MKKIILLSALIIVGVLFTAQIKRACFSLLILIDAVRPQEKPLLGMLVDGPRVERVSIQGIAGTIEADLYRTSAEGRRFPLLLVHGVNASGKDDEQLVRLARDLARAGFLVLVPDLEGLKTLRIRTADAEDILRCFQYLSKAKHSAPRGGMMGISYGAGPMLLAAADPRIRDTVSVVATFGGYYELRTVMLFSLTGGYEYREQRGHARPDASLRWMFAYRNLELVSPAADRELFRKIIEKRNRYELKDADALARALGPEGRALHDFLGNTDPERFATLYEALPLTVRELAYQLSPGRAIKFITASFIIAHGMDDYSVPFTESMRLADAVGDRDRVRLALLPQFTHIDPVGPSATGLYQRYLLGGWRLYAAIYDLLEKGGIQ